MALVVYLFDGIIGKVLFTLSWSILVQLQGIDSSSHSGHINARRILDSWCNFSKGGHSVHNLTVWAHGAPTLLSNRDLDRQVKFLLLDLSRALLLALTQVLLDNMQVHLIIEHLFEVAHLDAE